MNTPLVTDNRSPSKSTSHPIARALQQWREQGWLRALDSAFANTLAEMLKEQGETPAPLLLLLATLLSHQVGRGHVCLQLDHLLADADKLLVLHPETLPQENSDLTIARPAELLAGVSLQDCQQALMASAAVSDGDRTAPLVLADNRLYLRRFWRYEQQIRAGIQQRLLQPADQPSPLADPDSAEANTLTLALQQLFPNRTEVDSSELDYQKIACALAANNRFSVITGGPGTGKTTTVVKLLAALQAVAGAADGSGVGKKLRIRLAAPTGKAAARLNESIAGAVSQLPLTALPGQVTIEDIPTKVTTLHRLLGSRPNTRRLRHHRDNPLLVDILVIDEASMVDVELMAAVFEALPASARLILLGDKDQLASVDAGAVLGDLCQRAEHGHYTATTAQWLQQVTGYSLPDGLLDEHGIPLDQAVAMLRKSYRFGATSGIRILADAVNQSDLKRDLLDQFRQGHYGDVTWLSTGQSSPEQVMEVLARHAITGSPELFNTQAEQAQKGPPPVGYRAYLQLLSDHSLTSGSPKQEWDQLADQALQAFGQFQLLCALRNGPWGLEGINELVAQQLYHAGLISKTEGWYAGRPVLITANDYNLGLMNGDIGITLQVPWDQTPTGEPKNTLRVAFPAGDGSNGIRWVSPSRLQQLETVYAMTVHKSQGSEFGHCCLVLPDRLSPVMTKELIYTGVTRAKHWFSLVAGSEWALRDAVRQKVERASGLNV